MSSTTFYNSQNLVGIGSVGIGTTNPGAPLTVGDLATVYQNGTTSITKLAVGDSTVAASGQVSMYIGKNSSANNGFFLNHNHVGDGSSSNYFKILGYGQSGAGFCVQSSGSVGIGTTNPTATLDIVDQNNAPVQITEYNSTDGAIIRARSAKGTLAAPTGVVADFPLTALRGFGYTSAAAFSGRTVGIELCAAETFTASATGSYIRFDTCASGGTTYSEKMRILGSGNVGIGRVDPLYKFNVDNGSTAGPTALFQASTLGNAVKTSVIIGKTNTNNNSGTIVWNHQADADATNYLGLGCWNSDNTLNITAAARVGIGITNPTSYTLQVFGTTGCSGDIIAYYSDDRLKTRTGKLENALVKVCSLDTFTYVTNDLAKSFGFDDDCQRVGLSAQQVQKVLPEAVKRAPFDAEKVDGVERSKTGQNYLTVQYEKIVPLLVEALKEEKSKREALEERVIQMQALLSKVLETVGFPS